MSCHDDVPRLGGGFTGLGPEVDSLSLGSFVALHTSFEDETCGRRGRRGRETRAEHAEHCRLCWVGWVETSS